VYLEKKIKRNQKKNALAIGVCSFDAGQTKPDIEITFKIISMSYYT
jgi:hypothetical protein